MSCIAKPVFSIEHKMTTDFLGQICSK